MTALGHLRLELDTKPAVRAIDAVRLRAEQSEQFRQAVQGLLCFADPIFKLRTIKDDGDSAIGALKLILVAEPSDRLRDLLSACGARDLDFSGVDEASQGHGAAPEGDDR